MKKPSLITLMSVGVLLLVLSVPALADGPVIANLQAPDATMRTTQATITWTTDVPTDSIVYYANQGQTNWSWQGVNDLSTEHTVTITGLMAFTTYQYYVNAKDASSVVTKSDTKLFTTTTTSMTEPLVISNITIIAGTTTASVSWDTSEMSNSSVHYFYPGTAPKQYENWNWDKVDDYSQTHHSVTLTNLQPSTTYYYDVGSKRSTDYALVKSVVGSFTTTSPSTFSITNLRVPDESIRPVQATITWTTDVPTDSIVYYVEQGQTSWTWQGSDSLTQSHSVIILNLKPFTTYQYYVNAKAATGGVIKSDTKSFTTTTDTLVNPQPTTVLPSPQSPQSTPTPTTTQVTAEQALNERIKQLEYRVSELEQQLVETEKRLVTTIDTNLTKRLAGRILLQVQNRGEAWYVDKDTGQKFYLQNGDTAYTALQAFGLGITNANLAKIPVAGQANTQQTDTSLTKRLNGKILLQVQDKGQAWYVLDGQRYYMADGPSAYQLMRNKSLGVTNQDLRKIPVGDFNAGSQ